MGMFAIDPLMRGNFSLDIPIEETTVWSVYQEQQPLWVVDWQQDERSNIRMEAQNAAGAGYRSLCRLPLRTPQGCTGVLSIAGFRPHRYSEHEIQLLLLVADQVALGLANRLGVDVQRRIELELDKTNARMKLLLS